MSKKRGSYDEREDLDDGEPDKKNRKVAYDTNSGEDDSDSDDESESEGELTLVEKIKCLENDLSEFYDMKKEHVDLCNKYRAIQKEGTFEVTKLTSNVKVTSKFYSKKVVEEHYNKLKGVSKANKWVSMVIGNFCIRGRINNRFTSKILVFDKIPELFERYKSDFQLIPLTVVLTLSGIFTSQYRELTQHNLSTHLVSVDTPFDGVMTLIFQV